MKIEVTEKEGLVFTTVEMAVGEGQVMSFTNDATHTVIVIEGAVQLSVIDTNTGAKFSKRMNCRDSQNIIVSEPFSFRAIESSKLLLIAIKQDNTPIKYHRIETAFPK